MEAIYTAIYLAGGLAILWGAVKLAQQLRSPRKRELVQEPTRLRQRFNRGAMR